jgi:hypothetical protein
MFIPNNHCLLIRQGGTNLYGEPIAKPARW